MVKKIILLFLFLALQNKQIIGMYKQELVGWFGINPELYHSLPTEIKDYEQDYNIGHNYWFVLQSKKDWPNSYRFDVMEKKDKSLHFRVSNAQGERQEEKCIISAQHYNQSHAIVVTRDDQEQEVIVYNKYIAQKWIDKVSQSLPDVMTKPLHVHIRAYTWHHTCTFHQLMLLKMINLFLCVKKPNKKNVSLNLFFNAVVDTFMVSKDGSKSIIQESKKLSTMYSLKCLWKSFPGELRSLLWIFIQKTVQKYGK